MLSKIVFTAGVLFFVLIGVGIWFSKETITSKVLFDVVIGIILMASFYCNKKRKQEVL